MPDRYSRLLIQFKPDLVLVESVVKTGQLNDDKIKQVHAHDRLAVMTRARDIVMEEVTPQAVKRVRSPVPVQVKGRHAKDAYRVIVAYFRSKGQYESNLKVQEDEGRDTTEATS